MRKFLLALALGMFGSSALAAGWQKINEADYTWGPFKVYHIALYSEDGQYREEQRPLMLELTYEKPVDGRDFAISVARSWENLGIEIAEQEEIIDLLRKQLPDLKPQDTFSYIALADKGYFVHNDSIVPVGFNPEFSRALLAIWLDPKVEWSNKLTKPQAVENEAENAKSKAKSKKAKPVKEEKINPIDSQPKTAPKRI